jgi:uncharacterized protein YraI
MFKFRSLFLILLILIASFGVMHAQNTDSCGVLTDIILESAQDACGDVGTNEVCHAKSPVSVTLPDGVSTDFETGDKVDLSSVGSLSTSDVEADDSLGIAIANAQMNLSEGSVQLVLFGDVTMTNLVEAIDGPLVTLTATNIAGYPVNVRDGAGTNFNVAGTMDEDASLTIDGRNEGADWFRVTTDDGIAWVYTSLVSVDGDVRELTVLDSPYTAPMQNFTLSASIDETSCSVATSGVLMQYTGDATAQIGVNGVDIKFSDATLLLQATPSETLNIQVITGEVVVTSENTERTATSGELVTVGIDENLIATAPPSIDGDYDFANIAGAPTPLLNEDALMCVAGIGYGDEAVSVYGGPSDEYSVLESIENSGHYGVLGYAENEEELWWKVDTGRNQSWVPQASVRTAGICSTVEVADIPALVTNTTQSTSGGNVSFVPPLQSVWQAESGVDVLTGDCSNSAPLAVCSHLAAVIPNADGSIQWRGQEPVPYTLQNTGLNSFYSTGRNFQNNGNISLNLTFISATQWNLTYSTVYDNAPDCTHTFYYTGTPRW